MPNNVIRRKKYFVERGMQLRFARFVILFVFISTMVTAAAIFFTTFFMMGERLAEVYPQGRLVEIFKSVYMAFFIILLLVLPIIFYGSIKFSHRIAGPLPKIYETLRQIGKGNFEVNLVLRKRDELLELANVINEMARNLKERDDKDKSSPQSPPSA